MSNHKNFDDLFCLFHFPFLSSNEHCCQKMWRSVDDEKWLSVHRVLHDAVGDAAADTTHCEGWDDGGNGG